MKKVLVVVALLVGALFMSGCEGGNSVTGPSVGYNPSKPIDTNNRPPSPPEGLSLATMVYALYKGDCSGDVSRCSLLEKLEPTSDSSMKMPGKHETYVLGTYRYLPDWGQYYTLVGCVTHRGWAGRHLGLTVRAGSRGGGDLNFDEGDPTKTSPVCLPAVFNMMIGDSGGVTDTHTGVVLMQEDGYDLLTANRRQVDLGFRIVRQ